MTPVSVGNADSDTQKSTPRPVTRRARWTRWLAIATCLLLCCLVGAWIYIWLHWPYGRRQVQSGLDKSYKGHVQMQSFEAVYFPHPGFIAMGLELHRSPGDPQPPPPLAAAVRVVVEGRWSDLLTLQHRVLFVQIEGLNLSFPPKGTRERALDFPPGDGKDFSGPKTFIEVLHIQNALLEVGKDQGEPFQLKVHEVLVNNIVRGHASPFSVILDNPKPSALIHCDGWIGPLHSQRLDQLPVNATFTFLHGRLEDFDKLHGTIEGSGHFKGPLSALEIDADSIVSGFAVGQGSPVKVSTQLRATVDGTNGDVHFHSLDARTGATTVHASGMVTGKPKLTVMDLDVIHGRIEDLMMPFMHATPPAAGEANLRTHATLAAATPNTRFMDRLVMDGSFTLPAARLTKVSTEESLSAFSRRAKGENPRVPDAKPQPASAENPAVPLNIQTTFHLARGVVSTPQLETTFPGSALELAGTFTFQTHAAHLTGNLTMQSDISHVTTGFKSMLLKPFNPFFKHRQPQDTGPQVTVIPIAITGNGPYKIGSNLRGKK